MRNLYASTLRHFVLGLCFVLPMSANAAFTCNSTTGPASRVLAAQCAQCHGSSGEDMGSYIPSTGGEGPQVMHWQLQGYSDEQRCAIANCYSNPTACASTGGGGGGQTLQTQKITFGTAPSIAVGGTGTVSATGGSSGNPVTFTSITPLVCTIIGSTVTDHIAGTCTIAADQAGNGNYNAAAEVTQNITISTANSKAAQTLKFGTAPSITVGGTGQVSATDVNSANSANPVIYTSSTPLICEVNSSGIVTGIAVGTCTIGANQAGNASYNAAPQVTQTITISPVMPRPTDD